MSASRSFARGSAVQALYQMQVGGQGPVEIERQFVQEHGLGRADQEYFKQLLHGVFANLGDIDQAVAEFTTRPPDELDPVERAVLRLGVYELMYCGDTPYRVVINECVNLAKRFGATDGHKFVNGILDKVARKRRAVEVGAAGR